MSRPHPPPGRAPAKAPDHTHAHDAHADAERIFDAFAESDTVQLPLQETFWATRFGMLVDRFGVPWMINCGKAA